MILIFVRGHVDPGSPNGVRAGCRQVQAIGRQRRGLSRVGGQGHRVRKPVRGVGAVSRRQRRAVRARRAGIRAHEIDHSYAHLAGQDRGSAGGNRVHRGLVRIQVERRREPRENDVRRGPAADVFDHRAPVRHRAGHVGLIPHVESVVIEFEIGRAHRRRLSRLHFGIARVDARFFRADAVVVGRIRLESGVAEGVRRCAAGEDGGPSAVRIQAALESDRGGLAVESPRNVESRVSVGHDRESRGSAGRNRLAGVRAEGPADRDPVRLAVVSRRVGGGVVAPIGYVGLAELKLNVAGGRRRESGAAGAAGAGIGSPAFVSETRSGRERGAGQARGERASDIFQLNRDVSRRAGAGVRAGNVGHAVGRDILQIGRSRSALSCRIGGARPVGVAGGIERAHPIEVGGGGGQAGVGVRFGIGRKVRRDCRPARGPVGAALDAETAFIARVVRPGQVDLGGAGRGGRQTRRRRRNADSGDFRRISAA